MLSRQLVQNTPIIRLVVLLLWVFFARVGLAVAEATSEPEDAKAWLIATQHAMSSLNYRGMVSYLKDQRLENLQVVHAVIDGREYERLSSVNSPMREIVREPGKVVCYFPDSRSMSVDLRPARRSFLLQLPNDLNEPPQGYMLSLGGSETIARRPARRINIDPKDDFRYGRTIWVDQESKLPLKYELRDENDHVLEVMEFNSLSIENSIPRSELLPSTRHDASWQVKQHENLSADTLNWTFDRVPEGFRLIAYSRLKRGPDQRTIDHILLGDGFTSISIYIDEFMRDIFTGQPRKVGAINAYTRKLDGYLVTVMGEVPFKTVQIIANGIRQPDGKQP